MASVAETACRRCREQKVEHGSRGDDTDSSTWPADARLISSYDARGSSQIAPDAQDSAWNAYSLFPRIGKGWLHCVHHPAKGFQVLQSRNRPGMTADPDHTPQVLPSAPYALVVQSTQVPASLQLPVPTCSSYLQLCRSSSKRSTSPVNSIPPCYFISRPLHKTSRMEMSTSMFSLPCTPMPRCMYRYYSVTACSSRT